jgi:hypothetical protein
MLETTSPEYHFFCVHIMCAAHIPDCRFQYILVTG